MGREPEDFRCRVYYPEPARALTRDEAEASILARASRPGGLPLGELTDDAWRDLASALEERRAIEVRFREVDSLRDWSEPTSHCRVELAFYHTLSDADRRERAVREHVRNGARLALAWLLLGPPYPEHPSSMIAVPYAFLR